MSRNLARMALFPMSEFKAIVSSGNRKLIGALSDRTLKPGQVTVVHNAFELRCDMFMLPTAQGPIGLHKNTVVSLDAEETGVDISVFIDNIRWFDEMPDKGQKYDNMVAEFEEIMMETRAQRAGLVTARNVPKPNIALK